MASVLAFLGITSILMSILIGLDIYKNIDVKSTMSLAAFGIALSVPFIMVEALAFHLKYYIVILAFIAIEAAVLYFESHVKSFHDLIHHNVEKLRIVSFLIIGIGFTFSEVSFYIFHHGAEEAIHFSDVLLKTFYAMFMHTVFTTAASLSHAARAMENVFAEALAFIGYYVRLAVISVSHYLYMFLVEHHATVLLMGFMAINIVVFFKLKKHLDAELALQEA
jgi:hypothetical protein